MRTMATGQALIGAAAAALAQRRNDIPGTFLAELLGSAVPDDLQRYGPDELAAIAERSWSLFAERKAGAPKISFEPAPVTRTVAVLDIVNDDMPFLLNSVVGELNQRGLDIRLLVHPVFAVERDSAGTLTAFKGAAKDGGRHESFIHIHIEGVAEAARRAEIVRALEDILAEVRVAVQDWRPMLDWLRAIIAELRANPPPLDAGEIAEGVQFLEWLAADNFTLLGARDYAFTGNTDVLEPMFETGLGLLRSRDVRPLQRWNQPLVITPEIRAFLEQPRLLVITKSTLRSPVHRRVDMDYIGVKRFDRQGKLVGEYPHLRPVHLDRLYALGARHSLSAAQGRRRHPPRRLRAVRAIPARRWSTCWRPIRATNCSRSTKTCSISSRWPSCSSASVRACACCRGATASTVSSRSSSTFRASATTARSGR